MAVINTNYLALVSQNNLNKSQSALGSAIERLSSGLRINSAKDDAAGQAIANRFTANIQGLSQASRNANDGISIAQTTEGALNEINNNLQRIRVLSVQAANGTNSTSDLKSIQDEIQQRLDEIDRVSDQTQFNGVRVLAQKNSLSVQVGSQDSETIEVNLRQISSTTLNLNTFSIENAITSKELSASITAGGTGNNTAAANIQANTYVPGVPGGPNPSGVGLDADPLYEGAAAGTFAVKADDGNFYALTLNTATNQWVWDSSTTPLTEAQVNTAQGPITELPTLGTIGASNAVDLADLGTAITNNDGSGATGISLITSTLYGRNDLVNDPSGTQYFAVKGSDNNYYEVSGTAVLNGGGDPSDPADYTFTWDSIDAYDPSALKQISAQNIGSALTEVQLGGYTATPGTDLFNEAINPPVIGQAVFALADGSGYAVEADNGSYYAATVASNGDVSWDSSSGALAVALVDVAGGAVTQVVTGQNSGQITGLAAGETLHSYQDVDANTHYVIKGGTATEPTYTRATLGAADATTGDRAVTAMTGDAANITVDALSKLDAALKDVDSLRSELGAIQNRFESTIANLNNTVNNLSAARSRIEDADYAVEVSNMTRAQILQQAGTSVLAQANQVPQTVLSLLR